MSFQSCSRRGIQYLRFVDGLHGGGPCCQSCWLPCSVFQLLWGECQPRHWSGHQPWPTGEYVVVVWSPVATVDVGLGFAVHLCLNMQVETPVASRRSAFQNAPQSREWSRQSYCCVPSICDDARCSRTPTIPICISVAIPEGVDQGSWRCRWMSTVHVLTA